MNLMLLTKIELQQRKHSKHTNIKSKGFILVVLGLETMGVWFE